MKAFSPIDVIDDGTETFFNDEHDSKADFSIISAEDGIVISVNNEQPQNAHSLICGRGDDNVIWVNDEHPAKLPWSIDIISNELGIAFNEEQPEKEFSDTSSLNFSFKSTCSKVVISINELQE